MDASHVFEQVVASRLRGNMEPIQRQFRPYSVENLFSEHYLAEVLPQTPLWDIAGMEQAREQIRAPT